MRRIPSRELGSYVLEVAGVVVGIVVFLVGATDVAKIFQARGAVRAAVHEGTRCLYPTDADCVSVTPDSLAAPSRSFDVWVWGAGYQVERESLVASASWQQEPVMEVPALRDEVVDVTLEQRQFQYRPYTVLYPVTANTPYFLQTRQLPIVTGGLALNPHFADPLTRRLMLPNATHALKTVAGSTTQTVSGKIDSEFHPKLSVGSVSFSVSDAWPSAARDTAEIAALPASVRKKLACYFGETSPSGAGRVLNWLAPWKECRYRYSLDTASPVMASGSLRIPLLFRATGSTRGTTASGEGKVTIAMSWSSPTAGSGYKELGGRVFGYQASGDFVTRGLAINDIDEALRGDYDSYDRELQAYAELPLVPVDATVTLRFFLMSTNGGRVDWTGESLEVWYPQYRFVYERHACGYSASPSKCDAPRPGVPVSFTSLTSGAPFQAVSHGTDSCSLVEDVTAERDSGEVLRRLERSVAQGVPAQPHSFRLKVPTDERVCSSRIFSQSCEYKSSEYLKGCAPQIARERLVERCGIPTTSGVSLQVKDYTLRTVPVDGRRVRACSDPAIAQCAQPYARKVESARYVGGAQCSDAQVISIPPLTVGPLYANSCESRESSVQDMYRRAHAIPEDVPISVVRLPAPPVFSADRPSGMCVLFAPATGASQELLCGEGLSAQSAERCCAASGGRCRKKEVYRDSGPAREMGTSVALAAARQRVVEAVQAGYPRARYQSVCVATDPECLEVSAALANDEREAIVEAKMNVPLSILNLVDSDLSVVRYTSMRVLERSALR